MDIYKFIRRKYFIPPNRSLNEFPTPTFANWNNLIRLLEDFRHQVEPPTITIKKNSDGLLPCPFCGEYPKIGSLGGDKQNWSIWCECNIPCVETGVNGKTKEDIIIAWNKRKQ